MKRDSADVFGDLNEVWTVDQVASYLHKPPSWVYNNHKRFFHAARAGRQLLFSPDEIREWLKGQMWSR